MFNKLILRITHKLWNKRIAIILSWAYQEGVIDSREFHILASYFDPTQNHRVY